MLEESITLVETPSRQAAEGRNGSASRPSRSLAHVRRVRDEPSVAQSAQMPTANKPQAGEIKAALDIVHRSLRGRYWIVITLGLLIGGSAAALTWKVFAKPQYRSTGLLRIAYTLPEVVNEVDRNKAMPMFNTFMASQKLLITNRRVIDDAILDPIWREYKVQVPAQPDRYFAEHLKVDIASGSEFIQITVTDPDPATAAAAVTSTINAYEKMYVSEDERQERQRTGILEGNRLALEGEISQLNAELNSGAKEQGTELRLLLEIAAANVGKLNSALSDVQLALTATTTSAEAPELKDKAGAAATQPAVALPLTPEEIALTDNLMASYVASRDRAHAEFSRLRDRGLGEEHRDVKAAMRDVVAADELVNRYLATCRTFQNLTHRRLDTDGSVRVQTAGRSREELKATEAQLLGMIENETAKMTALSKKVRQLQANEEKLAQAKEELERIRRRLDMLKSEIKLGGRLSRISSGDIPLTPERDRRMLYAAAAGGTGLLLPAAALVGLSLLVQRRFRYSDETKNSVLLNTPLLGILPTLKASTAPTEEVISAGQCIHQIRVAVCMQARETGAKVHLMTSATSGEGKTSLTMALGLSLAASGVRTLIIDADLVGQHLTRAFKLDGNPGFREALSAGTMRPYLRRTAAGLYVLTAGRAESADACTMSSESVRALLNEARRHFGIVLVDSGPILGSLEAAVVGQESDAAVISISRGQQRSLVELAFKRLNDLKVPVNGMIFNRAGSKDFNQSAFSSTSSRASVRSNGKTPPRSTVQSERLQTLSRFGPVVHAAILGLPSDCN